MMRQILRALRGIGTTAALGAREGTSRTDVDVVRDLIDADWYARTHLEGRHDHPDAAEHYVVLGAGQGFDPHPLFSTTWYLAKNPDVERSERNPLAHFLDTGAWENRDPHPLFAAGRYLARYDDVARSGINPLVHYARAGAGEGRQPHPLFDVAWYLDRHPEGRDNPLVHFLTRSGRDAHPLFDDDWYRRQASDRLPDGQIALLHYLAQADKSLKPNVLFDNFWYIIAHGERMAEGTVPLVHYLTAGAEQGLAPHPLFDAESYLSGLGDGTIGRAEALAHFLHVGAEEKRSPHPLLDFGSYLLRHGRPGEPAVSAVQTFLTAIDLDQADLHPLFDARHYLATNPDVAGARLNPLIHYLSSGWTESRKPHPLFDSSRYLAENPDVRTEPLVHYLGTGAPEGRDPHPLFDTDWYLDRHETLRESGENPLVHFLSRGVAEGRNPHPMFDCGWYLACYPDVAQSGMNPLVHYVLSGAAEGRECRPPDHLSEVCGILDIPYEIVRAPAALDGKDVCLFVTHSPDGAIGAHVPFYLEALKRRGLTLVVVVATDGLDRPLPEALGIAEGLLLRVNHGWDFAAWAAAFAVFPDLWQARTLILTNDSLYGPIREDDLAAVLRRVQASSGHLVALTDSHQNWRHLMSYFVGITGAGLASPAIRRFWNGVKSRRDKLEVIKHYELVAVDAWHRQDIACEVLFETADDVDLPVNPTLVRWRELVERGFPFLKVQLLRDDLEQADRSGWEETLDANPPLRRVVEQHLAALAQRQAAPPASRRPIPAPKRRFHRSGELTTFYGATQSMRPTEQTDLALEVPFRHRAEAGSLPARVAVIAHIFYPELSRELRVRIETIPVQADLFVSTDGEEKQAEIEAAFARYGNGSVTVRALPNRGRDIAPTFVGFASVFSQYEYVLHIHSKRSTHQGELAPWRDFMLDNLLGSPEIVGSILELLHTSDVGIVFSQHFRPVRKLLNWGYDYDNARALLARAGIALRKDLVLEFPSGSFFWARSAALRPLLDLGLDWAEFEPEAGQIDGTLAHAIERTLLFFAEGAGFRWAKVARSGSAARETLVPVLGAGDLPNCLARASRPLLGNRLEPIRGQRAIGEVIATATRPSASPRPRLNIVLPTVHQKYTFGGVASAMRLFDELRDCLGERLGEAVDARILCTSIPLDVETMALFPGYRLVTMGTLDGDLPRTIVDLTDQDAGELGLRRHDVFLATAWWTAHAAGAFQAAQRSYFGAEQPLIYFVQDYESDFYARSARFGLCEATYRDLANKITLVNSEELALFMSRMFAFEDLHVVRYTPNAAIIDALKPQPRERIILVYGRPNTPRNCFETIRDALISWQQANPTAARHWRVVSVGEEYERALAGPIQNLEILGKLSLADYAAMLGRSSVGISLMLSPHPSYPPLEMAQAGLITLTNGWGGKDLRRRNPNIVSLEMLRPEPLAEAIDRAVRQAEGRIGEVVPFSATAPLPCPVPEYDPAALARRLAEGWTRPAEPSGPRPLATSH